VKSVAGGVEIIRVTRKSPAFHAGLHRGDVVTMIDATRITSEESYQKLLARKSPQETVRITVSRDGGGEQELTVKLAAKPVY
jgi:S1-C subfamily serine protease